jgi:hypothetical protein
MRGPYESLVETAAQKWNALTLATDAQDARVAALVEAAQIMLRAERDGLASLLLSVQQDSIAATKALATARADGIKEGMRLAPDVPLEELPAEYDRAMKDAKP